MKKLLSPAPMGLVMASGLMLLLGAIVMPSRHNPYSSSRDGGRSVQPPARLTDLYGNDLGEESFGALGGTPNRGWQGGSTIEPLGPGLYRIELNGTGTAWAETFLLAMPEGPLRFGPLLVLFHGYGERPEDVLTGTTFFEEALERGWYVMAPLGAHEYNFGIEYAQRNVELAMNFVAKTLPIDVTRLYGVGFSMGGGMAASYAARHQDLYGGRFAAIANHTGVTSLSHSFRMAMDDRLFLSPLMFGVTPDQDPFVYSSVSSFDLDPVTAAVDQNTDMLRNLVGTPVRTFAAMQDPLSELLTQMDAFENQLALRGGFGDSLRGPFAVHEWSTMDETATLNWLASQRLRDPSANTTHHLLADRTGRWHGFYLRQRQEGVFTPLIYHVQTAANRLHTIGTENLNRISVHAPSLGLQTSDVFEWSFGNTDNAPVELVLRGVTHTPIDVHRNGTATVNWRYDPTRRELTLTEPNAAAVPLWRVYF